MTYNVDTILLSGCDDSLFLIDYGINDHAIYISDDLLRLRITSPPLADFITRNVGQSEMSMLVVLVIDPDDTGISAVAQIITVALRGKIDGIRDKSFLVLGHMLNDRRGFARQDGIELN
jgi:hypothetical protein